MNALAENWGLVGTLCGVQFWLERGSTEKTVKLEIKHEKQGTPRAWVELPKSYFHILTPQEDLLEAIQSLAMGAFCTQVTLLPSEKEGKKG